MIASEPLPRPCLTEAKYWDKWAGPLCARHAIMDMRARPVQVTQGQAAYLVRQNPKWEFCIHDPDL